MLTLFTNRFQAFQPPQGVPVRITLGAPRFKLPYSLTHSVRELAPRRDYLSQPEPEFTTAYRADLDRLGPERIAARLRQITQAEGDHRLVLLCFEDRPQARVVLSDCFRNVRSLAAKMPSLLNVLPKKHASFSE